MVFSDSHCHLESYRPELLAQILDQAKLKHVDIILTMAMTLESSADTILLTQAHKDVVAAIGIHPWNAIPLTSEVSRRLHDLAKNENVMAIGEIGLDYVMSPETKDIQKELLMFELSLARESGLPVSVHCKEAHQDLLNILRKEASSDLNVIIHGFSDDITELKDWLDLDFYISIGMRGIMADKIPALQAAIREIPMDRLLTETDSALNRLPGPVDVVSVAEKLASIRGTTTEEIANTTTSNLKHLLKIS